MTATPNTSLFLSKATTTRPSIYTLWPISSMNIAQGGKELHNAAESEIAARKEQVLGSGDLKYKSPTKPSVWMEKVIALIFTGFGKRNAMAQAVMSDFRESSQKSELDRLGSAPSIAHRRHSALLTSYHSPSDRQPVAPCCCCRPSNGFIYCTLLVSAGDGRACDGRRWLHELRLAK